MKFALAALATLTCFSFATPTLAKELVGQELVNMVNGKTLKCKAGQKNMTIKFGTLQKNKIKFDANLGGRKIKSGYRLTKKGKFAHETSGASRKFVLDGNGVLTMSGNGIAKTKCPTR